MPGIETARTAWIARRLPLSDVRARHAPDARAAGRRVGQEDRAGGERAAVRLGDGDPLRAEAVLAEVDEVRLAVGLGVGDLRLVLVHEPGVPQAALVLVGVLDRGAPACRGRSGRCAASSGRRAASSGSRSSILPSGATTNTPPSTGRRMRKPLYSRYGTRIRGPSGVSMPTGLLERDEEAPLEQPPAQVVRDLQARARTSARRRSGAASGRSARRRARRGPGSSW